LTLKVYLPDKTLREIARQQPQTLSDLRRVSGVGEAKLEKFGDAVLAIIQGDEA
jgi:ATP-dependent DNA helicase RecQ